MNRKIAIIALTVFLAVFSYTVLYSLAQRPAFTDHCVEQTDEKIAKVMALSGGATATSGALTLLPGDACTPIAQTLAELAKYFLVILSILYFEKFLLLISAKIAFKILIPAACLIFILGYTMGKKRVEEVGKKIAFVALVIWMIVPLSVALSDLLYDTQSSRIDHTIESYGNLEIEEDESTGFLGEIAAVAGNTIDNVSSFLSNLIESLAVMIVTTCIIPVLVFVFLVWLVKTVFTSTSISLDFGKDKNLKLLESKDEKSNRLEE